MRSKPAVSFQPGSPYGRGDGTTRKGGPDKSKPENSSNSRLFTPSSHNPFIHNSPCSSVHINGAAVEYGTPFGGYKQSGNGREGGVMGLEDYLETKSLHGMF